MVYVGQLIKRRRLELDLTQEDIEERTGFDQSYISQVERGVTKRPGRDRLKAFADALDMDVNELLIVADHAPEYRENPRQEVMPTVGVPIPLRGRVPADTVRWMEFEQEERTVDIPADWVNTALFPLFAVEVSGDCLLGRGIADGDIVVCEEYQSQPIRDGAIVLVRIDDEYTMKAWHPVSAGEIELHDGHGTVVRHISLTADVQIIGIAKHRHGDL